MFVGLGGAKCFLLAAMAYDRYVAICYPLHYAALLNPRVCARLALVCCLGWLAVSVELTLAIFHLPFCGSRLLVHFFCDITALLYWACTRSYADELPLLGACLVLLLMPSLLILAYGAIVTALRRLRCPGDGTRTPPLAPHTWASPHYIMAALPSCGVRQGNTTKEGAQGLNSGKRTRKNVHAQGISLQLPHPPLLLKGMAKINRAPE
ncbi:Olfactory Receptor 10Ac1 [Manis pentadactyla]|nr:Olfactory Receptor 10Ac1 [Manis pentadactyla]